MNSINGMGGMDKEQLVGYIDQLLNSKKIKDYCPNGLQVQGTSKIKKIISAVTASECAIDQAIAQKADILLVHHGYFWKGENSCITGMKFERIKKLISHNINLLAYHLPLDLHQNFGNNAQLAKVLGFNIKCYFDALGTENLAGMAELDSAMTGDQLAELIRQKLMRKPLHISPATNKAIYKIAWITGAAQDAIEEAAAQGCDAFISGEVSERTYYQAQELDIHYFAAGHHATERYGVQALGEHLAEKFKLDYCFVDSNNPV